jgi:hypothetical protein
MAFEPCQSFEQSPSRYTQGGLCFFPAQFRHCFPSDTKSLLVLTRPCDAVAEASLRRFCYT